MNRRQRRDLTAIVTMLVNAERGGTPLSTAFLAYLDNARKESRDAGLELAAKKARDEVKVREQQARDEDDKWLRLSSHMHHDIANGHRAASSALHTFADTCDALRKTPLDDTNI